MQGPQHGARDCILTPSVTGYINEDSGYIQSPDTDESRNSFDKDKNKPGKLSLKERDHGDEHSDDGLSVASEEQGQGDQESARLLANATTLFQSQEPSSALAIDDDEHVRTATALRNQHTSHAGPSSSPTTSPPSEDAPVTWLSLPRKDQLLILVVARLSEPLTQTSLAAYMFYQLRSFDPTLPDATISQQAGLLGAAFTGAQFLTAMLWGRVADSPRCGRKRVLLIGLLGTAVGSLGFGFSGSFAQALMWRVVGGALNGNVGVMRTMISEIIRDKKYQSRAFLTLPMTFNLGVIVGPVLGGALADPVKGLPWLFGEGGWFAGGSGEGGVGWMVRWPYALPNLVSAGFLVFGAALITLGLEETLPSRRERSDVGLTVGRWIKRVVFRRGKQRSAAGYQPVALDDQRASDIELLHDQHETNPGKHKQPQQHWKRTLPFRAIFTPNVLAVLVAHGMLAAHVGLFGQLWFVFMSTPRYVPLSTTTSSSPSDVDPNASLELPPGYRPHPPLVFTGGLALPPPAIGTSLAILGVLGLTLQFSLFPIVTARLGTVGSYRVALALFPIAYVAAPFLALVPTPGNPPPSPAGGWMFWAALVGVLLVQVCARTFALPATAILVNNACPHPSVLGTVHGVGQSVSSGLRTIGPVLGGWGYGRGLSWGVVGAVWWIMAVWALFGAGAGLRVKEGDGHEIWLEGDEGDGEGEARTRQG